MNKMSAMVVLCLALGTVTVAQQPAPLTGGERILWIGNSYSDWCGPIGACLRSLFNASSPPISDVRITNIGKGMGILKEYYHCDNTGGGAPMHCVDSIRKGGWDIVVVQGWEDAYLRRDWEWENCDGVHLSGDQYTGWPGAQDTFVRYAELFYTEVEAIGAKMIIDFPHMANSMFRNDNETRAWQTYRLAAEQTGAYLMPSQAAWDTVAAALNTTNLCPYLVGGPEPSNDNGHQNSNGMALDAYFFYTVLTGGRSPVGLNPLDFPPRNDCNGTFTPDSQLTLQTAAYRVATAWLGTTGTGHARAGSRSIEHLQIAVAGGSLVFQLPAGVREPLVVRLSDLSGRETTTRTLGKGCTQVAMDRVGRGVYLAIVSQGAARAVRTVVVR